MRIIKFKAYDKGHFDIFKKHKIFDVLSMKYGFGKISEVVLITKMGEILRYKNQIVLLQFIGLKIKNGNEIYEGDILKFYNKIGEVMYEAEYGGYVIYNKNNKTIVRLEKFIVKDCEIIGNIYENPELLK